LSTTDALLDLAKNLGPALTGVAGAVATLWKTTHRIFDRLKELEEEADLCKVRAKSVAVSLADLESRLLSNDNSTRILDAGYSDHDRVLSSIKSQLASFITQAHFAKTLERLATAERHLSEIDDEIDRLDKTLVSFAKEQNEQWQGINRSLGKLEGFIKASRASVHDD
jgi:chromosome segregation ATPase